MKIWELLKVAFDALLSNKLRSFLTMLGVVIGVASVILLVSIGQGVSQSVTSEIEGLGANLLNIIPGRVDMGPGGRGGEAFIRFKAGIAEKLVKDIKELPEAVAVTEVTEFSLRVKYGNKSRNAMAFAVGPDYLEARNFHPVRGEFFNWAQYRSARNVCLIGDTVRKDLFGLADPVGKTVSLNNKPFRVIGVMEKKGSFFGFEMDNIIILPFPAARKVFNVDYASYLLAKINNPENLDLAKRKIERIGKRYLDKSEFSVISQEEVLSIFGNILGTLTLMLGGIAGISLLVGGIGIMNIMLVSVTERTKEIGIRKAVGAKTSDILSQFLVESVTLSVIGGVLGILIGYLGSLLIKKYLVPAEVTLWSVLLAFTFSAAVGIFFGVYPAYKAARVDPIVALRYE